MNFYKHFLGDYARDTAHLSMLEHGAYRLMLDHYYATGKSLPNDAAALCRICGAVSKGEREAVSNVANAFFPVNGDGSRHNHRADREIADAAAYASAQSDRANKRWGNRVDMPAHVPTDMPAHQSGISPEDASHSHSQIPEITKPKSKAIARTADAPSLDLGEGQIVETIPLLSDRMAVVHETYAAELDRLFPAVDVPQTLREIRAWNLTNPTRRKTPKGIEKHIAQWCQRVQNGGR